MRAEIRRDGGHAIVSQELLLDQYAIPEPPDRPNLPVDLAGWQPAVDGLYARRACTDPTCRRSRYRR
ncbi:MAG TPA: hypothetical protein VLI05_05440 [Candidatus Saccharimonadia bacterium]|nr:hypothetical protein [Candidatus Saccharimonadia bacterium]